jgi:hypothetical protein
MEILYPTWIVLKILNLYVLHLLAFNKSLANSLFEWRPNNHFCSLLMQEIGRFEVLTVVLPKIWVLWGVMPSQFVCSYRLSVLGLNHPREEALQFLGTSVKYLPANTACLTSRLEILR